MGNSFSPFWCVVAYKKKRQLLFLVSSSQDCVANAVLITSIKHHHETSIKSSIKILLSINLDIPKQLIHLQAIQFNT